MSDEESDDDSISLIKRSPPWRSDKLNRLFRSLDEQYESKHGVMTKRNRRIGPFTERPPPRGLPAWALSEFRPESPSPNTARTAGAHLPGQTPVRNRECLESSSRTTDAHLTGQTPVRNRAYPDSPTPNTPTTRTTGFHLPAQTLVLDSESPSSSGVRLPSQTLVRESNMTSMARTTGVNLPAWSPVHNQEHLDPPTEWAPGVCLPLRGAQTRATAHSRDERMQRSSSEEGSEDELESWIERVTGCEK